MATSLGIVNPKKRREIDGVGSSSMVDLKATLFRAEDQAKRVKASGMPAPKSKLVVKPVQNRGVEERNRRDQEAEERRSDPSVSLADKMGQYEAMTMVGYRDDKESFLVDFEQKRWDQERLQHTGSAGAAGDGARDTDTPEAIVRRHQGDGSGAGAVLLELGDQMQMEKKKEEALKAQRLAAAKKRMLLKKT